MSEESDSAYVPKASVGDLEGRFNEILADPNNAFIPRVAEAGQVSDGLITMHNGLRIPPDYYGAFSKILRRNKGVHEPQEERVFQEVLKHIPAGATMIEFGAYWGFYSMWFQQIIPDARNILIEPEQAHLECGRRNFEINDMRGEFVLGAVGDEHVEMDRLVAELDIGRVDLLHADIQGAEYHLMNMLVPYLEERRIGYLFISTHGQALHELCTQRLRDHDYLIVASADFEHETFCYDGVLVARDAHLAGPEPLTIALRNGC